MKKLRVNKKYGVWYYEKIKDIGMGWYMYSVQSEDGKEHYILGSYSDMVACIKESTKEDRKKFERMYG